MTSLLELPNELLLSQINARYPFREQQVRSLATLLSGQTAPCRNIVAYGLEAVGKSAIIQAVLDALSGNDEEGLSMHNVTSDDDVELLRYTKINSPECITGRQLLEQTTGGIASAIGYDGSLGRCENLAQLLVDVGMLMEHWRKSGSVKKRFVLVFDGIDTQKEAPPTLLPALARLGEYIPNLTTIFIVTSPPQHFLHLNGVPHVHFPAYTKPEILGILNQHKPNPALPSGEKDTMETWSRYCAIIWDTLSKYSGRDILSFKSVCAQLWPTFIRPILDGQLSPAPFSKLILANRSLLQNDNILNPSFVASGAAITKTPSTNLSTVSNPLTSQLPTTTRLLLISSYLCSHNPPKTDITYFCKSLSVNKRRKRGGGTALTPSRPGTAKHRKISRRLLGPQAFTLERMLAVFHFLRGEMADGYGYGLGKKRHQLDPGDDVAGSADLLSAFSTLVSLRLVSRLGGVAGADLLDGGSRYRVNMGWEVVRGIGRSVGIEVEYFVAE